MYDTVIVGGGPAGLSAALVLGRCRRHVIVCDAAAPRNACSRELHGFLTRDGIPPAELLRLGREELRPYGVDLRQVTVTGVHASPHGFEVALAALKTWTDRVVLCSNGPAELGAAPRGQLARQRIEVREARIASFDHADGRVRHVVFATGERLACDASRDVQFAIVAAAEGAKAAVAINQALQERSGLAIT